MENSKIMEENLREAACFGNIEVVKDLLSKGVNVNAQNDVNGWSALHWAAYRNYIKIVDVLLKSGANKKSQTRKGESPYQLTTNKEIQIMLEGTFTNNLPPKLPIMPSYIENPPLFLPPNTTFSTKKNVVNCHCDGVSADEEVVLKVRVANSLESDFIEIDLPKTELTFEKLVKTCCEELQILPDEIIKIRKLPDTLLRRDKDVARLKNFQEIEVVMLKAKNLSPAKELVMVNRNQYESISLKKDQTVLY